MAKMVDIEKLKPLLADVLNEDNEAGFIEGVMAIAEDYDEDAIQARIDEAVEATKAEEAKNYSAKLHDMFFGGSTENKVEDVVEVEDDTKTDPELNDGEQPKVEDIFEEVQ